MSFSRSYEVPVNLDALKAISEFDLKIARGSGWSYGTNAEIVGQWKYFLKKRRDENLSKFVYEDRKSSFGRVYENYVLRYSKFENCYFKNWWDSMIFHFNN